MRSAIGLPKQRQLRSALQHISTPENVWEPIELELVVAGTNDPVFQDFEKSLKKGHLVPAAPPPFTISTIETATSSLA